MSRFTKIVSLALFVLALVLLPAVAFAGDTTQTAGQPRPHRLIFWHFSLRLPRRSLLTSSQRLLQSLRPISQAR